MSGEPDIPTAFCCGTGMSPDVAAGALVCGKCQAHVPVDTRDYIECSWCKLYYHKNYVNQIGDGGDAVDMCIGCQYKDFPEARAIFVKPQLVG
jgi:hypothetical protein